VGEEKARLLISVHISMYFLLLLGATVLSGTWPPQYLCILLFQINWSTCLIFSVLSDSVCLAEDYAGGLSASFHS